MAELLLAEQLFLLTHDDLSGKHDGSTDPEAGLAGALLLDLASDELVVVDGKKLHVPVVAPEPAHELLAAAFAIVRRSDKTRTAQHWVRELPRGLRPLRTKVGQSLVERGVLTKKQGKVLGLFTTTKWPEVDPEPERQLRKQLHAVLVDGAEPDDRMLLLIMLLAALDLVRGLVPKDDRKAARARAKELAARGAAGAAVTSAVKASVQATQAAVTAAVTTSAIVSTMNN